MYIDFKINMLLTYMQGIISQLEGDLKEAVSEINEMSKSLKHAKSKINEKSKLLKHVSINLVNVTYVCSFSIAS